jgi:hypothetical protein
MLITELDISTEVRLLQREKADAPMLVTELGIENTLPPFPSG